MTNLTEIIEKILGVLGYDAYSAFIKVHCDCNKKRIEYKLDNEFAIKKGIIENNALSIEQKIALNTILDKNLVKFKREAEILGIAFNNMDENAKFENLDEDWILDFFDKASCITEDKTKLIWGKMLSYAASDKNICSKTLLNSIFLMGTEEVTVFLSVCQFCLSEMGVGYQTDKITSYPMIYFSKHVKTYSKHGISSLKLNKLQNLGLLEVDMKSEFVFSKKDIKLIYKNKIVELEYDKKIKIGNVRFTYEGFLLYQMTEKIYNNNMLEYTIEIWKRRGYRIYLNEKQIN